MSASLKELPSVDQVLDAPIAVALLGNYNRDYVVDAVRSVLQETRERLLRTGEAATRQELSAEIEEALRRRLDPGARAHLHRVINATGIVLHTGLGRAPLPTAAVDAIAEVATHYCNLEVELDSGKRGSRLDHVRGLLCAATGADAAAVVNNNAAAVVLMLNTLARGSKVLVSRGELVEIGGSFRIPDIIESSGARIREVGTTNRTHLRDYADAIDADTAMILAVHPSNYRVQGFTARPEIGELAELGRQSKIPFVFDLGGGVLEDLAGWQLPHEPVVRQAVQAGVDLVSFSGDKVLGGPQSGIIVGAATYVERIVANPLMRALRCDKMILSALEATLKVYRLCPERLREALPVLRMMTDPVETVGRRAEELVESLSPLTRERLQPTIEPSVAQAGSGALPLEELPTRVVVLQPDWCNSERLARTLRLQDPSVMGRIHQHRVILDMRTVFGTEVKAISRVLDATVESAT